MLSAAPVRERVAQTYHGLSSALRQVADALIEAPLRFIELPIDRLAAEIGVGTSAVSRFARRLGYDGTRALRLALARDLGADSTGQSADVARRQEAAGSAAGTFDEVVRLAARSAAIDDVAAIRRSLPALDSAAMVAAAAAIATAPRVITVGYNSSGSVADRLAMMLRRRGWRARAENTPADASWPHDLDPNDLVVAISHRGDTRGIVEALPELRARGARLLAVTNAPEREVGRKANVVLATAIAGGATDDRYEVDPVFPVQIVTVRALVAAAVAARTLLKE